MNALDNLTVCITSWRRAAHLDRAIGSCRAAGIRRLAIAAVEHGRAENDVVAKHRNGWLSFDVASFNEDIGCNNTWMQAAYQARTERIIILHDDDVLLPAFGSHYEGIIAPILDSNQAQFATWEAQLMYDDGSAKPCRFWNKDSGVRDAVDLLEVVARFGRLSLSPILSVLDRTTVIHACKEAAANLTTNTSLERPGMLLGTEILVYLRHVTAFKRWFYLSTVLAGYGAHAGSGTVKAQQGGYEKLLTDGYDLARRQGFKAPPPAESYAPQIILTWSSMKAKDINEAARFGYARRSWEWLMSTGQFGPCPVNDAEAPPDIEGLPYVNDVFNTGARMAMQEDIVLYVNMDNGLTSHTYDRITAAMVYGNGACACPRRNLRPAFGRLYHSVRNCRTTGGYDAFAFTPEWWRGARSLVPKLVLAREAWDTVIRIQMHEGAMRERITSAEFVNDFMKSPACCDDVCYHTEHFSRWQVDRQNLPGNLHNLAAARAYFLERGIKFQSVSFRPAVPE